MIFIVISQRAKGNNRYSLKDLPGHGRIDVIFRVILAALRPIIQDTPVNTTHIFVYLKGTEPHGWLYLNYESFDFLAEDEISLAGKIQKHWRDFWSEGSQEDMYAEVKMLVQNPIWIELHEKGVLLKEWNTKILKPDNIITLLGAQRDMTETDTAKLKTTKVSLGSTMYLASQAITILRTVFAL